MQNAFSSFCSAVNRGVAWPGPRTKPTLWACCAMPLLIFCEWHNDGWWNSRVAFTRPFNRKYSTIKAALLFLGGQYKNQNHSVWNQLSTDKAHFAMTDYIVLQAVSLPLFFFFYFHSSAWKRHKQQIQIEHNDKKRKTERKKTTTTGAIFAPMHPFISQFRGTLKKKKKVISFVMCDSLFASMYTGNFIMAPPVILLLLSPISKRHPGTV